MGDGTPDDHVNVMDLVAGEAMADGHEAEGSHG